MSRNRKAALPRTDARDWWLTHRERVERWRNRAFTEVWRGYLFASTTTKSGRSPFSRLRSSVEVLQAALASWSGHAFPVALVGPVRREEVASAFLRLGSRGRRGLPVVAHEPRAF